MQSSALKWRAIKVKTTLRARLPAASHPPHLKWRQPSPLLKGKQLHPLREKPTNYSYTVEP
jgi:hypothetical protein